MPLDVLRETTQDSSSRLGRGASRRCPQAAIFSLRVSRIRNRRPQTAAQSSRRNGLAIITEPTFRGDFAFRTELPLPRTSNSCRLRSWRWDQPALSSGKYLPRTELQREVGLTLRVW